MNASAAAKVFAELGNETRLAILLLLIKSGREGLSIADIQSHLEIPLSTLSFHIQALASADLIQRERQGRMVMCRPNFAMLDEAVAYLKRECCVGVAARGRRQAAE
jgi:DNA-binding transcriptional ArsR family regulator